MSEHTRQEAGPPARTRRRGLLAGAVLLAGALVIIVGLGLSRGEDATSAASAPTTAPAPSTTPAAPSTTAAPTSAAPSEAPTSGPPLSGAPELGDAVVADELPPSLSPVPLNGTAEVADDGVSATLERMEAIEGTGVGPGNVAGPALRATVRIENRSSDPVDLDGVAVTLSSGEERVPAAPLGDPSIAPFTGTLAPGDTAEGVYVFTVAEDARDLVTVSVGHRPGAPFMVFTGPAA